MLGRSERQRQATYPTRLSGAPPPKKKLHPEVPKQNFEGAVKFLQEIPGRQQLQKMSTNVCAATTRKNIVSG